MSDPAATPILRRHVTAAVIGNALEFYDFTTYAFFATQIGETFFPGQTPFLRLISALIVFGVGFATRPVGAVVLGRIADKAGRKPAMLLSLTLMGVSIVGLALTPSYRHIGIAAPILVLAWRLAQGFALGGEVGPTTAYLVEAAPPASRGMYGAWQTTSQSIAAVAGGLIGTTIAHFAGPAGLEAWGWRLAFLLGAAVLPFGFYLRRSLPETLHHPEDRSPAHPPRPHLRGHVRILVIGLALIAAATISTYVGSYMTTYAINTLHMPVGISLEATLANGAGGVVGGLTGGFLADRFGRKPLLIWPRVASLLVTVPAFMLMVRNHDQVTLLAASALLSLLLALSAAPLLVGLTESLDKSVRGVGMGAVYALAVSIFGGTTQPAIAWLTHVTGNPLSPGWYMVGANAVGLVASLAYRESAHAKLAAAK